MDHGTSIMELKGVGEKSYQALQKLEVRDMMRRPGYLMESEKSAGSEKPCLRFVGFGAASLEERACLYLLCISGSRGA